MSEHIATIQHLYSGPTGTNTLDATQPRPILNVMDIAGNTVSMNRTWSGTFGDGNVTFSLPKDGECQHGSSRFMCVFCEKWYGPKQTTEPSKPESSEKTGSSSSLPLSPNGTSGMCSSLHPQSPSELFSDFQGESKSDGLRSRLSRTLSFAQ